MIRIPTLPALALLLAAAPASAALYKCVQDGTVVYADQACANAQPLKQPPLPTVPALKAAPPDTAKVAATKTGKTPEAKGGAKAEAAQKKKCDKLALRRRWAEQDVQNARAKPLRPQDKSLDNAQRKARRTDDLYRLECSAPS